MKWFDKLQKQADVDFFLDREAKSVFRRLKRIVNKAINNKLSSVLPRWRGEIRRQILLLPSKDIFENISMYQINNLDKKISHIENLINKYDSSRWMDK